MKFNFDKFKEVQVGDENIKYKYRLFGKHLS